MPLKHRILLRREHVVSPGDATGEKNVERLRHSHRRSIRGSLFFPREENTVILDATPRRATQRRMALQPSKVTFIFVPNIPVAL